MIGGDTGRNNRSSLSQSKSTGGLKRRKKKAGEVAKKETPPHDRRSFCCFFTLPFAVKTSTREMKTKQKVSFGWVGQSSGTGAGNMPERKTKQKNKN